MDMSLSEIIDELFMRLAAPSRWAWKVSNGRCPDCELKINRVIKDIIGSTMGLPRLISSLSIPRLNLRAGKARPDAANDSAYQGTWSLILDDSRYD